MYNKIFLVAFIVIMTIVFCKPLQGMKEEYVRFKRLSPRKKALSVERSAKNANKKLRIAIKKNNEKLLAKKLFIATREDCSLPYLAELFECGLQPNKIYRHCHENSNTTSFILPLKLLFFCNKPLTCIALFSRYGADFNLEWNGCPLWWQVVEHFADQPSIPDLIRCFLKYKADVGIQNSYGSTCFHFAASKDERAMCASLIEVLQEQYAEEHKVIKAVLLSNNNNKKTNKYQPKPILALIFNYIYPGIPLFKVEYAHRLKELLGRKNSNHKTAYDNAFSFEMKTMVDSRMY